MYKIYPTIGSRIRYTLNIIDTPGFGDTRGIERDNAIVDQIRELFSSQGDRGVLYIDAVCFIVRAPDARLTTEQTYIFSSIMSLFGKDIKENICTLVTFADGAEPAVLASLNESGLPFGSLFNFNNSALFAQNKKAKNNSFSSMFWNMGCKSFEFFFIHISQLKTKSLCQTNDVLEEREQLKTMISNIQPQITAGLSKLSELDQQLVLFKKCKDEIANNQNFEYTVDETRQDMVSLPQGQHVTNCTNCNVTCHDQCTIADDDEKRNCSAMDSFGNCKICDKNCEWLLHKNTPFVFKYVTITETRTYADMKQKYEKAVGQTLTHENYIAQLTHDVEDLFDGIKTKMSKINRCKTRLKEIALNPHILSEIEHIDLMIESEQKDKQPGYLHRVHMLKQVRKKALVGEDVEKLSKNFELKRKDIKKTTGKSFRHRKCFKNTRTGVGSSEFVKHH